MSAAATRAVLDSSALLAYLGDEPGADVVADAIAGGVSMSTINLAETLSTLAARGSDPAKVVDTLTDRGLVNGAIAIEPFTTADAIETARLRPLTHEAGLSLADRGCLALTTRLATVALTADHAWDGLELDVDERIIREAAS
jgi:PIN domain nuclease of toxin-antitoxin system